MKRLPELVLDLVGLAGLVAIVNGARLIYPPAAWLVAGAVVVAWAVLKGRAIR